MLHKLAWFQLITEKRRLGAALAGIAFAVMLQLTEFGVRDALFESAINFHKHLVADLVLTSSLYENELLPGRVTRRRLYQALGVPGVESVAPVLVGLAPFKNILTGFDKTIVVIGFEPDEVVMDIPEVNENVYLVKVPDVALFDTMARPEFGPVSNVMHQSKEVTTEVAGRRTRISGLFELGISFGVNGNLIVSDATFRRMFNRSESICEFGLIRLKPGTDVRAKQAELMSLLPDDVKVLTRPELNDLEKAYWHANTPIGFIFTLGAIVGLLVGLVIVYQILYTDVSDHLAEYATMKAMGYSDRHLNLVVLEEALILSILGFPVGLGLAQLIFMGARNATHLPIYMTVALASMVFGFTVLMCAASGLIAVRKLKSADPAEVF
jgi:putative ABC transport system permease protein